MVLTIHHSALTIINFGAKVDDTGIHSFLMVKLDDNKIIKVNYNKASKFDIGKNRDSNFVYGPPIPRTIFIGIKLKTS